MVTTDKLFSAAQRVKLAQAAEARFSCRAYTGDVSISDWSALTYLAGRYALPGVRLALTRVDDSLFTGMLIGPGRVTGCRAVFAVFIDANVSHVQMNAGLAGEAVCLELTAMGYGSCWLTGTFRRKQLEDMARRDEQLLGVIAVGHPAAAPDANRRRKPLDRICRGDISQWPIDFRRAAELVRLAPSAMNLQPWELSVEGGALCLDGSERARLDLGIALCHAELALTAPHEWLHGHMRTEPMLRAVLK